MLGTERLMELARCYIDPVEETFIDEQECLGKLVEILARHVDNKLVFKWLCEQILISR